MRPGKAAAAMIAGWCLSCGERVAVGQSGRPYAEGGHGERRMATAAFVQVTRVSRCAGEYRAMLVPLSGQYIRIGPEHRARPLLQDLQCMSCKLHP
jgi:hypothetical protein